MVGAGVGIGEWGLGPIEVQSWEVDCVCVGGWGGGETSQSVEPGVCFSR